MCPNFNVDPRREEKPSPSHGAGQRTEDARPPTRRHLSQQPEPLAPLCSAFEEGLGPADALLLPQTERRTLRMGAEQL